MIRSLLAQFAGFAQFVGVLVSIPVYGGVITTQTFDFGQATATVTVLYNYHGDRSKEDWIYTINNLSFTTQLAFGAPFVGLSAFGGAFQGISMDHVSDVTGIFVFPNPLLMGDISPGFCVQCDLFGDKYIEWSEEWICPEL